MSLVEWNQTLFGNSDQRALLTHIGLAVIAMLGLVALFFWIRTRRKILAAVGLSLLPKAPAEFGRGLVLGGAAMVVIFWLEWSLGLIGVKGVQLDQLGALPVALAVFTIQVVLEEVFERGLLLNGLFVLVQREWLAVGLMGAVVGLMHAGVPQATVLSAVSAALGGVMFALPYFATRRLWMSIGLHLGWNFVEHPVLGFPTTIGNDLLGGLVSQLTLGPALLTGGAYGPEGGLIGGFAVRLLLMSLLLFWLFSRPRNTSAASRRASTGVRPSVDTSAASLSA